MSDSRRGGDVRGAWGARVLVEPAALDGKERPFSVLWVLLEEAGKQLEVSGAEIMRVEFACRTRARCKTSGSWNQKAKTNAPELMSIFTPGGSMSTPALIASKHCSSGTGRGVHLCGVDVGQVNRC